MTVICGNEIPDSEFVNKVPSDNDLTVSRSGDVATVTAKIVDVDADQKINVTEVSGLFDGETRSWSGDTLTVKIMPEGISWNPLAVTVATRIMQAEAAANAFRIEVTQDYVGVLDWPVETEEVYEYIRIDIEDTDGNYYGSVSRYPDDDEIYWTLNGSVWEYRPYIEEVGEPYQNKICASFNLVAKQWTIFYDDWGWTGEGEDEIYGPLPAPANPDAKYFITVNCQSCPNQTQYPYRYKDADKGDVDDAVTVGAYTVAVPIYYTTGQTTTQNPDVEYESLNLDPNTLETIVDYLLEGRSFKGSGIVKGSYSPTVDFTITHSVVSSIPYRYTEAPYGVYTSLWAYYHTEDCYVQDTCGEDELQLGTPAQTNNKKVIVTFNGEVLDYTGTYNPTPASANDIRSATGSGGRTHTFSYTFTHATPDEFLITNLCYNEDTGEFDEYSYTIGVVKAGFKVVKVVNIGTSAILT